MNKKIMTAMVTILVLALLLGASIHIIQLLHAKVEQLESIQSVLLGNIEETDEWVAEEASIIVELCSANNIDIAEVTKHASPRVEHVINQELAQSK